MVNLTRRLKGHFVKLTEVSMHLVMCNFWTQRGGNMA